jgi:hypothetical protein
MRRRVGDSWFKIHIFGLRPTLNFLGAGIESVPVVFRCRISIAACCQCRERAIARVLYLEQKKEEDDQNK